MKTVIVGGVAGGMSAATRLRRVDESAEIVVFERGPYVSYANCGLPYFVGGVIPSRDDLLLHTPQSLAARFRLDVRTGHRVESIDPAGKTVTVTDLTSGDRFAEPYDHLVLAVGASAAKVDVGTSPPIHTLRTVDDVDSISEIFASRESGMSAVVIGGGFIGMEAVDNLIRRGTHVTLVQRGGQLMSPLDEEMAAPLLGMLRAHGIDVRLNTTVTKVADGYVHLSDGAAIAADLVVEASGVTPDTSLALDAGLVLGESGGIRVDRFNRTSDKSIYAVGDGVEKPDAINGGDILVTMAGLANRHGRSVADAIGGEPGDAAVGALGTGIVKIFDTVVAMVGWNEKRLVHAGRPHRIVHSHPTSHATYFPGAEPMSMKLLIDADTDVILGAQIVGGDGVDKRIDVISVAMAAGITASRLSRLELAYAPQFGSAKDPINQLGYIASNLAEGTERTIQWHELDDALASGEQLIDVRNPQEFSSGHIPGAVNIPLDQIRDRLDEFSDGPVVVHCQVGQRGHTASRILAQHGKDVRNLDGGYRTWQAGQATERKKEKA